MWKPNKKWEEKKLIQFGVIVKAWHPNYQGRR